MPVKKGNKVKVDYTGTFDDGDVFDTSVGKEPLEFEAGSGQVIKGFDDAVIGMKKGEEKEIKLKSADAYGDPRPELMQKVPRNKMPQDQEPRPGIILLIRSPDGNQFPARIAEVTDSEVTIDLNHPLAGKNLNFKIKVVDFA